MGWWKLGGGSGSLVGVVEAWWDGGSLVGVVEAWWG